jgi:mannose-6-phosphate isomerase-like protein (cupin superfamily)
MNRRRFLQSSLLAAAFGPSALAAGGDPVRMPAGMKVGAGQDRWQQELLIMGGRFQVKVSTRDTGGDLLIYDTIRDTKGGPALHKHHAQDEWFYVLRGKFVVRVGDETLHLGPGDSAFAPRRVPHTFAMIGEEQAQMLVLFQPAGQMEEFFQRMATTFGNGIPAGQEAVMRQLWADHGMEIVGPPLAV